MKIVNKGWGYEKWIVNKKQYCGKLLYFVKGKSCSLHYHEIKDETFYLQSGKIQIESIEKESWERNHVTDVLIKQILLPGDSFYVSVGLLHRMIALENSELFEFSTQHFDSDSYRVVKGD